MGLIEHFLNIFVTKWAKKKNRIFFYFFDFLGKKFWSKMTIHYLSKDDISSFWPTITCNNTLHNTQQHSPTLHNTPAPRHHGTTWHPAPSWWSPLGSTDEPPTPQKIISIRGQENYFWSRATQKNKSKKFVLGATSWFFLGCLFQCVLYVGILLVN